MKKNFTLLILICINSLLQTKAQVSDIEGNAYKTITIGSQIWIAENLKTTKYIDGTDIPLICEDSLWSTLSTPAYCWYNNDPDNNRATYGALYNWFAVNTGKLCPAGWHVPSNAEWMVLTNFAGGNRVAGSKLKEAGLAHWTDLNEDATNETGFTAIPAGYRTFTGLYFYKGTFAFWWSSTEFSLYHAMRSAVYNDYIMVENYEFDKISGMSVRCLKD